MDYILSGDPKEVQKVLQENRIRVGRGLIKFTPCQPETAEETPQAPEVADTKEVSDVVDEKEPTEVVDTKTPKSTKRTKKSE